MWASAAHGMNESAGGDHMIDTITGITGYLGVTSAKNFAGVYPYKDESS